MNRRFRKLCSRLFTTAAGVLLLLLGFNLVNWYLGFDSPQLRRFGQLEFTWQSPWVIVHSVSQAEETWRQQVENRATIDRWFENWRSPIDRELQLQRWGSEPYLAALARYRLWDDSYKVYQRVPRPAPRIWTQRDGALSLFRVSAALAVLPVIWSILAWRRSRERLTHWLRRRINWPPGEYLSFRRRARRIAFLGVSVLSLFLAFATAVEWLRSHYVNDSYSQIEVLSPRHAPIIRWRRFQTLSGGFAFSDQQVANTPRIQLVPDAQGQLHTVAIVQGRLQPATIAQLQSNAVLSDAMLELNRRRQQLRQWQRSAPSRSSSTPWYGVRVQRSTLPGITGPYITVRWWVIVVMFMLPPIIWVLTHLRFREVPAIGCCLACGYNLTGNTSGICPECGESVRSLTESK